MLRGDSLVSRYAILILPLIWLIILGPFGGDTKNPILFVSNTLDPATPIAK